MKIGTKTLLFGVHQFILHPFFVLISWLVLYKKFPNFAELCAIVTHDWGLFGMPNLDGEEGETHPLISASMWDFEGKFFDTVKKEILGHSRFYAKRFNMPLSRLFYADKLCIAFYPTLLYLLLGWLSGEITEYMCHTKNDGKYSDLEEDSRIKWLLATRSKMTLFGLNKTVVVGDPVKDK